MDIKYNKDKIDGFISKNYNFLNEGESVSGSRIGKCFRHNCCGEHPSECHLHVRRSQGNLQYNCFGAKCGIRGTISTSKRRLPKEIHRNKRIEEKSLKKFYLPKTYIRRLSASNHRYVVENGITPSDVIKYDIGEDTYDKRVIFPAKEGESTVGFLSRGTENQKLKWVNKVPKGYCYKSIGSYDTDKGVLVEAPTSAIVLGNVLPTIAILGSTLPHKHYLTLSSILKWKDDNNIEHLYVWLDPDATNKARKIKNILTQHFTFVKLVKTVKKPRYHSRESIKEILK